MTMPKRSDTRISAKIKEAQKGGADRKEIQMLQGMLQDLH
jgi:hypothetical protein